jgi:hypothetical protein
MLGQAGFFLWTVVALTLKEIDLRRPAYERPLWQQLNGLTGAE